MNTAHVVLKPWMLVSCLLLARQGTVTREFMEFWTSKTTFLVGKR